nr:spore coat protein SP96-like [Nothobranchius furzeri]
MAADGWTGLFGSMPSLAFDIFFHFLLTTVRATQQRFPEVKHCLDLNQVLNNRNRKNGYVGTLLLCLWLLIVPPVQSLSLSLEMDQPSTTAQGNSLNDIPRLKFFGHGYLATYSIFWQKEHYNEKGSRPIKQNKWHAYNTTLLLLSGDIQLNPGPLESSSSEQMAKLDVAETLIQSDCCSGMEPTNIFHVESSICAGPATIRLPATVSSSSSPVTTKQGLDFSCTVSSCPTSAAIKQGPRSSCTSSATTKRCPGFNYSSTATTKPGSSCTSPSSTTPAAIRQGPYSSCTTSATTKRCPGSNYSSTATTKPGSSCTSPRSTTPAAIRQGPYSSRITTIKQRSGFSCSGTAATKPGSICTSTSSTTSAAIRQGPYFTCPSSASTERQPDSSCSSAAAIRLGFSCAGSGCCVPAAFGQGPHSN